MNLNDPTYDGSGFITNMVDVPTMSGNPWEQMAQDSAGNVNAAGAAQAGIPKMTNNLNTQAQAMAQYGGSTMAPPSPYPAHANDFGLGSTPQNGAPADGGSTNRGNPWMLQGDALSR